jgi:hypothetical protein
MFLEFSEGFYMFLCVNSIGLESNECLKDGTSIHAPGMDDFIFADGGLMELATVAAPQHFFQVFSSAGDQAFQKLQRNLRQHGSDSVRRLWICWICMDLSQEWSFHGLCSCMIFVDAGQCFHAPCQGAVLLCRTFAEKRGIELRGQHRAKKTLMSNMSSWTA